MASLQPDDTTKTATKKPKTTTPEGEKDSTYWEKRNKNNLSARKSRESKRQQEIETRVKVDNLKEENFALRKKIASIKKRHGLPLNVSVMTKEETEQCMAEITSLTLTGEIIHSPGISNDAASSTSTVAPQLAVQTTDASTESSRKPPATSDGRKSVRNESLSLNYGASVYGNFNPSSVSAPVPVQQTTDDLTGSSRESHASSVGRESVRHTSPSLNYGASVYGPFSPSPSWPPVALPQLYASSYVLNYPLWAGHGQGPSAGRGLLERSSVPQNYFVHKGMPGLGPGPFGYYAQYGSDRNQRHYSSSSDDDIARNRSKGHRKQKGASKGKFNDPLHKRDALAGGLSVTATAPFLSTPEQGSYTGGAALDLSSSGRVQSQFSGPFKLPLPTTSFRNRYNQPAATTTSDGQKPCNDPEKEFLSQENAQLKGTIQTLIKEITELKAAVHKDQARGHP
ncbi:hypothetical protein BsWGS_13573 [Bradybaena similaris]